MKYYTFINIFLIIILLSVSVFSQKETPPAGSQPKDFILPEAQMLTLENGLEVTMVQYGDLPKAVVRVVVQSGNLNESPESVWLADITVDLMKEGAADMDAGEIAKKAAGMGGAISTSVGLDQSWIGGEVLSEFTPDLVALLSDIVLKPTFPAKEFERLKKDFLRDLNIKKTQPQSLAQEKFAEVLYGNHPYGRVFPTEEMLTGYTRDQVMKYYDTNFGALRAHIYVVGKFDQAKVETAIQTHFSSWKKGEEPLIDIPEPQSKRMIYLVDRPDAPQSTVYMGLPVIDPTHSDYFPLGVTNALLGGYFSSRITTNIREDKGYTYSPRSRITNHYRDAFWVQTADVSTDVTGAAIKEIFYEIDRLQNEAPTAEELEAVQNFMSGIFVLRNSSRAGIIGQLSFMKFHGLEDYLNNYVKNIFAVTPEKVQEMAQKYLKDEEMTLVIVGDKNKVPGQVKRFAKIVY
jgi:predicted Zn-dependent peptidase